MDKFINRQTAGKVLATMLTTYANQDAIVLALPRGGVPVAYEIAIALQLPLDVFIVRKIGVPEHPELAMGAIANGVQVFNQEIINDLLIKKESINAVIKKEEAELKRRDKVYRGNFPFPELKNKVVILVDDGVATGATMRAAISALRAYHPKEIVVAVPVADLRVSAMISELADQLVVPLQPVTLYAVGAWYKDFAQVEDDEVHALLQAAREKNYHA